MKWKISRNYTKQLLSLKLFFSLKYGVITKKKEGKLNQEYTK